MNKKQYKTNEGYCPVHGFTEKCPRVIELKAFETAVKKRHNGYNPEARKALGIKPPASPEQALQDLQDEWDGMEKSYATEIAALQTENQKLKEVLAKIGTKTEIYQEIKEVLDEPES
jgi:hypothetical protein